MSLFKKKQAVIKDGKRQSSVSRALEIQNKVREQQKAGAVPAAKPEAPEAPTKPATPTKTAPKE